MYILSIFLGIYLWNIGIMKNGNIYQSFWTLKMSSLKNRKHSVKKINLTIKLIFTASPKYIKVFCVWEAIFLKGGKLIRKWLAVNNCSLRLNLLHFWTSHSTLCFFLFFFGTYQFIPCITIIYSYAMLLKRIFGFNSILHLLNDILT